MAIYYIDLGDSFTKLNSDSNVEFMQEILKWGMEALIILGITKSALCPMNLKRIVSVSDNNDNYYYSVIGAFCIA